MVVFGNRIFLGRPVLLQQSACDLLAACSERPRAGRQGNRAYSVGSMGRMEAQLRAAGAPCSRLHSPLDLLPQSSPVAGGSGSFENLLTPVVTPLGEAASPSATLSARKRKAVPHLKAKGPFISRAPASNWPFVH